jgi:hypothetical protein
MRVTIFIFGFMISYLTCSYDKRTKQIENELNSIVNELAIVRFPRTAVIQIETQKVFKEYVVKSKDSIPEPPPPGFIFFPKTEFNVFVQRNLIDSLDADYMYSHIDSSKIYHLNSSKISKPLISAREKGLIFKNDFESGYHYLKSKYGTSCFILVSSPVFNKNFTKAILTIDYCCGPLNGQGYIIILGKENNKWKIIKEYGTWVS